MEKLPKEYVALIPQSPAKNQVSVEARSEKLFNRGVISALGFQSEDYFLQHNPKQRGVSKFRVTLLIHIGPTD
jgi:hypothetical protein